MIKSNNNSNQLSNSNKTNNPKKQVNACSTPIQQKQVSSPTSSSSPHQNTQINEFNQNKTVETSPLSLRPKLNPIADSTTTTTSSTTTTTSKRNSIEDEDFCGSQLKAKKQKLSTSPSKPSSLSTSCPPPPKPLLPLLLQPSKPSSSSSSTTTTSEYPSGDPTEWNCEQVFEFVKQVAGANVAQMFMSEEVDGSALSLIRDDHLVNTMQIKLGPALKIMSKFNELKQKFHANEV
jgi:hypothetical protein